MRLLAVIPVLLTAAALVLSFLCLFAGSKQGFMEDYALVTLNTSRIGIDLVNTTSTSSSSNPIISWFENVTNTIENEIENDINSLVRSIAKDLGLHDFYSAHILNYCEGYYTPSAVPNATLKSSSIHKNITYCSNLKGGYSFDPRALLQADLDRTGSDVNLTSLKWPDEIDKRLKELRTASEAMFVLYCIAIVFIAIAFVTAVAGFFLDGRFSAFANMAIDSLAFIAILLASALVTAIMVESTRVINKYGNKIGASAKRGSSMLAITWVATAIVLVASCVRCVDRFMGRSHRRGPRKYA